MAYRHPLEGPPQSIAEQFAQYNANQRLAQQSSQQAISDEWQRAQDEARAKNEARYQDILGQYQGLRERGMGYIEGVGEQQAADISQRYKSAAATGQQDLVSRGFAGTSVLPTMQMGYQREETQAQNRLQEDLARERLSADVSLTGQQLGFMERREDTYPDQSEYMRYMNQLGQGQGGTSFNVRRTGGATRRAGTGSRSIYGRTGNRQSDRQRQSSSRFGSISRAPASYNRPDFLR